MAFSVLQGAGERFSLEFFFTCHLKCAQTAALVSLGQPRTWPQSGSKSGHPLLESFGILGCSRVVPLSWVLGDTQVCSWVRGSGVPVGVWSKGWLGWGTAGEDPGLSLLCFLPRAETFGHFQLSAARLTELRANPKRSHPNKRAVSRGSRSAEVWCLFSSGREALQERAWGGTGGKV